MIVFLIDSGIFRHRDGDFWVSPTTEQSHSMYIIANSLITGHSERACFVVNFCLLINLYDYSKVINQLHIKCPTKMYASNSEINSILSFVIMDSI